MWLVAALTRTALMVNVGIVALTTFAFQGLALAHASAAAAGLHPAWLVALYALAILAPPQVLGLLAVLGVADNGFDFRARLHARRGA